MLSVRYGMYGNWVVTGPCTHWCVVICLSTRVGSDFIVDFSRMKIL